MQLPPLEGKHAEGGGAATQAQKTSSELYGSKLLALWFPVGSTTYIQVRLRLRLRVRARARARARARSKVRVANLTLNP